MPGNRWVAFAMMLGCARGMAGAELVFQDGFESDCGATLYVEDFEVADSSPWPDPWVPAGSVAFADVQDGATRLRPTASGYSLARMFAPVNNRDVEVRFTFSLEDEPTQGVGFYVRQNGGYLENEPPGEGYAVFLEGSFRGQPGISVWKEDDGSEQELLNGSGTVAPPQAGVDYRVRFRVHQVDAGQTRLQAKMWAETDEEPAGWQVSFLDDTPSLQGVIGGIAVDSWSVLTSEPIPAHTRVDDIQVEELCNPLRGLGTMETVSEIFMFIEGPVWRDDHLLFSDIDADTIYRLVPPSQVTVFRNPSGMANGLVLDNGGLLLAAEHANRRVSRTLGDSTVVTLVDDYLGMAFNAPNDLAVAADDTVYFTDPSYGLADPGDREIGFNGVFRRRPDGSLVAEWEGQVGVNEPNGVALSSDGMRLYVSDTQAGALEVFEVSVSGDPGALSNRQTLATGLTIPDGMCLDDAGNVFLATWLPSVEGFSPDGAHWGSIPMPRAATNCTIGGVDGRSLYVTATEGLYRFRLAP